MSLPYNPKLSRRVTLQWIAATSFAAAHPRWTRGQARVIVPPDAPSQGYGTDPNLKHPVVPWPLVMDSKQLQQTAVLADLILPGTASAPAPSALGVPDFVNEWVSAPYPDQQQDRAIIFAGLRSLDAAAAPYQRSSFLELDSQSQQKLVAELASRQANATGAAGPNTFFRRFRLLVTGAYYTTPEGFKDIGYTGNVPIASYPEVTAEERAILDRALTQLGLSDSSSEKRA